MKTVNGISLFTNVGIDELYLKDVGINIVAANELVPERAKFYSNVFPSSTMVCGDINKKTVFNKLVDLYKKNHCNFVIATPPCQGMSIAGKMKKDDIRNQLIVPTINFILNVQPKNALIENVPGILKFKIYHKNKWISIVDFIKKSLLKAGYYIKYKVLDAADYGTPQYRKRAIFLISKTNAWCFPDKQKHITIRQAIGNLPSLESGQKSNIKYHSAKKHNKNHILWMMHTPTGKSALMNKKYFPVKPNGQKIKGFSTTYKRMEWDEPAPTITMCNGAISSQNNVHPGRKLSNGTYSDARVLTILEIMLLTGINKSWKIPSWASDNLIRKVIGECFPPKFCKAILKGMPK